MVHKECKITSKGQITIPVDILKELKAKPGDSILFQADKGQVELCAIKEKKVSVFELMGKYKGLVKKSVSIEEMDRAIEEGYKNKT